MKHAATVALGLVVVASSARAQVSCSDPANLCTGDPCVITAVMVASPCTVDFGPRTVIIQGNLRVPAAGTLSFTAGAITLDLNSRIDGTDLSGGGAGADVTLQASGEIDLKGRGIDTSGSPGGAITVEADGMLCGVRPGSRLPGSRQARSAPAAGRSRCRARRDPRT